MKSPDCSVVGTGAAGMMCAITAAEMGKKVLLIEKNKVFGKKLRITGKGRCNVTNDCDADTFFANVVHHPAFLRSAYASFSCYDTMAFFERLGVPLKTERGGRVFPVSDRASDIVQALTDRLQQLDVSVVHAEAESLCFTDGRISGVRLKTGEVLSASRVVLACGGASYPATGSDGTGYRIAADCGHTIVPLTPSLVPVELEPVEVCRQLQGLSLRNVAIRLVRNGNAVYRDFGEMLFTHFGVSGPIILSASTVAQSGDILEIDLKPALDFEQLDKRVCQDFAHYSNKNLSNALGDLLPSKLIPVMIETSGLSAYQKVHDITKAQRQTFVRLLKNFSFTVKGLRPIEEAIVTAGGVDVRQVNPKDMQSKLVTGLYFAGEILDVDAYTGGFNLQIAFSTGYKAGLSVAALE